MQPGALRLDRDAREETSRKREYRLKDNTAVTARCTWNFGTVVGGGDDEGNGGGNPDPEPTDSLTASFEQVPSEHAGKGTFDLLVRLSETVGNFSKSPRRSSFKVTQGRVRSVKQADTGLWRVRIKPASWRDVTVTLAGGRGCDASGAVCTPDGRALSNTVSATVGGQGAHRDEAQPCEGGQGRCGGVHGASQRRGLGAGDGGLRDRGRRARVEGSAAGGGGRGLHRHVGHARVRGGRDAEDGLGAHPR